MKEIFLAGGCFWGTERLMTLVPGVVSAECGYANGDPSIIPDYRLVCSHTTLYRETVRTVYDPSKVSLEYLLCVFYASIDPSLVDRQGNDFGPQYQACVFWSDPGDERIVREVSEKVAANCDEFKVILEPLNVFFRAEEEHQGYLERNPSGYCHVEPGLMRKVAEGTFVMDYMPGKMHTRMFRVSGS